MKKILVTGGSGFIGSHTCYSLLENNYDLFVIDSLTNSNIKSIERIKNMFMNKKINISSLDRVVESAYNEYKKNGIILAMRKINSELG